ncbi:hypothetical protein AMATHDRAFT_68424 [Amanita thiersii Skay4041]|uniref:Bromo domain-containing protein n=1 Tax=Amanita thiersii Skay4041 TaxID=703135 RepID=A0A2A9NH55_9AGAR|nr:hypothetical protein AMATHDRAFT_68424 [Amanita thiersii Skay4041]
MNNLLRTLTESQAKSAFPDTDLRLLLTTVKEARRQNYDSKLSDAFYDSLEGLLHDLRTTDPDNRDAEAFNKPVSKSEVPDYYDVISTPMDLQTMSKKVKQKQYKSKREFQDDLDLIWSNCFTYNAVENHPLRRSAVRLRAKADSLLKNITDRKERTDPFIPPELGTNQLLSSTNGPIRIRLNGTNLNSGNGAVNGRPHRSSVSTTSSTNSIPQTLHNTVSTSNKVTLTTTTARPRPIGTRPTSPLLVWGGTSARPDIPFSESPALVRTAEGMSLFHTLDEELDRTLRVEPSAVNEKLTNRLAALAPAYDYYEDIDTGDTLRLVKSEPDLSDDLVVDVGEKRKPIDHTHSPQRPRKRARFSLSSTSLSHSQLSSDYRVAQEPDEAAALTELWWGAVQSDVLLSSGLPSIPVPSSMHAARMVAATLGAKSFKHSQTPTPIDLTSGKPKTKYKSKSAKSESRQLVPSPHSLLAMMNANMKTMKRVRHTHARFATLVANSTATSGVAAEDALEGSFMPSSAVPIDSFLGASGASAPGGGSNIIAGDEEGADVVDDKIDERSWLQRYLDAAKTQDNVDKSSFRPSTSRELSNNTKKRKKFKVRRSRLPVGVEMGEQIAGGCIRWMGEKVLEHVGFQGTSKAALDVLSGVATEYLYNVGRTIKFMSDRYSQTMTPEEIILHTLFESGTSKIQDLERYITDDIRRHGTRLGELEKKLVGAYRESTAHEILDEEDLFEEEEEDETGALAIGDFADVLGEDYLGLRELGIAAEFGMSSLTIPKKLLRSKKLQKASGATSKPTEPPPPYPPPPPFVPLIASKADDQIGLLKSYYRSRFSALASSLAQPTPESKSILSLSGPPVSSTSQPSGTNIQGTTLPTEQPTSTAGISPDASVPLDLVLPDDPPNTVQVKMGPLGQIVRGGTTASAGKKKAKAAVQGVVPNSAAPSSIPSETPTTADAGSPKKKKGVTGVGTGNGRKKKADGAASGELRQSSSSPYQATQGKPVVYPPVVVASA